MRRPVIPFHVVGVGCGGSYAVQHLAKRGAEDVPDLHAWDGDSVDEGNTRSQTYLRTHIGMPKVLALEEQVREWGGIALRAHPTHLVPGTETALSGIVIVAVDSMRARREIWESAIRANGRIARMIELRLDATESLVYAVDPNDPRHIRQWERRWYSDEESGNAGLSCGTTVSLFPIADITAAICVTYALRAREIARGEQGTLENETYISLNPLVVKTETWK